MQVVLFLKDFLKMEKVLSQLMPCIQCRGKVVAESMRKERKESGNCEMGVCSACLKLLQAGGTGLATTTHPVNMMRTAASEAKRASRGLSMKKETPACTATQIATRRVGNSPVGLSIRVRRMGIRPEISQASSRVMPNCLVGGCGTSTFKPPWDLN